MSFKPTNLGAAPLDTAAKLTPTRLGEDTGGIPTPREALPTLLSAAPLPAAVATFTPNASATHFAPTAVPRGPAPRAVEAAAPIHASSMPGTQRKPLDVSHETLLNRFPGIEPGMLVRVQGVLAGVSPTAMDSTAWLAFGVPAQEELALLVKQRLALMESPAARGVAQHLSRLQALLKDLLDAMDGGFLKRSAAKVWETVSPEVHQLEALLSQASSALRELLGGMCTLSNKAQAAQDLLQAHALAAEYLVEILDSTVGPLLLGRGLSLTTSQTLALEQIQTLTLDKEHIQELIALVQDGVLLQLPSVYSQLAGLSAKPSDTQRFLATEKLSEVVQHIQRKL